MEFRLVLNPSYIHVCKIEPSALRGMSVLLFRIIRVEMTGSDVSEHRMINSSVMQNVPHENSPRSAVLPSVPAFQ